MSQTFRKYSRHIIALVLIAATVFTCILAFSPEADAGATGYRWRVLFDVIDGNNEVDSMYLRLYYKTSNGTGGETNSYLTLCTDIGVMKKDAAGHYYWRSDTSVTVGENKGVWEDHVLPAYAFPYRVEAYAHCPSKSPAWKDLFWTVRLEVLDQSGNVVADSGQSAQGGFPSQTNTEASDTEGISIKASQYPYVSTLSCTAGESEVSISDSSPYTASTSVSVSGVDQFGVDWKNAPSSISASPNTSTSFSSGSTSATLTFANASADYIPTVSVSWATANSSYSTRTLTATPTTVRVARRLYFDSTERIVAYNKKFSSYTAPVLTKAGYTFNGWYLYLNNTNNLCYNASGVWDPTAFGDLYISEYLNTANGLYSVTFDSNWTPITYAINYSLDGTNYTTVNYDIEDTAFTLPTPTKTGYTFVGWRVTQASGNWAVGDILTSPTGKYGNISVEQVWAPNNYYVYYDGNVQSNLFDYAAWKAAGITGSRVTISDITDTGFTITSTEGVDGYCSFSNPATAVEPSTEYTLSANIQYTVNSTSEDAGYDKYDIFVQFLTADGTHISYKNINSNTAQSFTFTTPDNCGLIKIRFDANYAANVMRVDNIVLCKTGTADNGADFVNPTIAIYDSTYGTLPTPVKAYYDFLGWFREDGTQLTSDETVKITSDLYVTSRWTPTQYSVYFNGNGGSSNTAVTYDYEDTSITLPSATRTGYTFKGWTVETANGNWSGSFNAGANTISKLHGNVQLKAVWEANDYTLSFDSNTPAGAVTEATTAADITVTYDSAVGTLPTVAVDGYTFGGWADADGNAVTAATVYKTADDLTVYAQWTPVTYTVTADENGGNAVSDVTYTIEGGNLPAAATKTGYTMSHWEVVADSGNWTAGETFDAGADVTGKYGNVEIKAVWVPNEYEPVFDLNYDSASASAPVFDSNTTITAVYDSALGELPAVTRHGYTFDGWFTAAEGGEQITADTVYTTAGTATYYAHWTLNTYTLTYDVVNGTAINPVSFTVEDDITLPVPEKYGYNFTMWRVSTAEGGWVRNSTYTTEQLSLGKGHYGNATLAAIYELGYFTITWVIGDTQVETEAKYNSWPSYDGTPTLPSDIYYEYTFREWSPAVDYVSGDATYTAQFDKAPKKYTVLWLNEDGTAIYSESIAYGEAIPDKAVPDKTGYTGAWDSVPATMPAENVEINVVYTPIKYTIDWIVEGITVKSDSVDYDAMPYYNGATPVKAATAEYTYTFDAWTPEITKVTGDAQYVATFTSIPNEYTITWMDGDTKIAEQRLAYGTAITNIPLLPEVIGKVGSWVGVPEKMPASDITIYSQYVEGCAVYWYVDSTEYIMTFANGEEIEYDRATPEKAADAEYTYTFSHWADADGNAITFPVIAGETTLYYYAIFDKTPNEYTITWVAEGVTVHEEVLAFGSDVTAPAVPDKTGYTGAWDSVPATMPAENVEINVVYTPIKYTITWIVNGVETVTTWAYDTLPVFEGSTAKESSATTDYTFAGWDKEITIVTGDATYTATYDESPRVYTVYWVDYDGTVVETEDLPYGTAITYAPDFSDWTPVTGYDRVYAAPPATMPAEDVYVNITLEAKIYTITWVVDGVETATQWAYDTTPVYNDGETPTKAETPELVYTFTGWSPEVTKVTGDAVYTAIFSSKRQVYTATWYIDGEIAFVEDIEFGAAVPKKEIPEKEGYTGTWDSIYNTMPTRDITINAKYTAKKYTVYWKVDGITEYSESVAYGDPIPVKVVPAKPGNTGVWETDYTSMPAQNITINAKYTPNTYAVTVRISGTVINQTATFGEDYKFNVAIDGTLPEELRITIGGTVVDTSVYDYDAETGDVTITGSAIIGDIIIVARAAGGNVNVIPNVYNCEISNTSETVGERTAYYCQFLPSPGYLVPESVLVYVDGVLLTTGFVYDAQTGRLTINAESVTGEIEIYAECPADPDYDPSDVPEEGHDCDCNCHSDSAFKKFFFDIITFLRKLFGMTQYQYCECGAAHW